MEKSLLRKIIILPCMAVILAGLAVGNYECYIHENEITSQLVPAKITYDNSKLSEAQMAAGNVVDQIAQEGMTLMKNDGTLPLSTSSEITLLGRGSVDPIYGGSGSGNVDTTTCANPKSGLEKAGFSIDSGAYNFFQDNVASFDKANIVMDKYDQMMDWLAGLYVNTLNLIHYMHDKYSYEALEFALHDRNIIRTMACGIAGLSVAVDSLSAIKYAKVKVIRDETGLATDYQIEGDFPKYGNDDDRVDEIAVNLVKTFMKKLEGHITYRNSIPTQSILTITSNVVYGKATGNTPDGRRAGAPFGPGANPLHGRDSSGALAVMNTIAKLPYEYSEDGISFTFSITPGTLGKDSETKINNLVSMLDGYFKQTGHHINVNVFDRALLLDAMDHPEKYPQLTIRVSGYAVNFVKLTREQQLDVVNRTIHERI